MLLNKIKLFILFFFLFLFIISIPLFYIELDFNKVIVSLERFTSNDTVIFLSFKLFLASFWFLFGIYSYNNLISKALKTKIDKLSYFELFLIFFTIFMMLMLIENFCNDYILQLNNNSNLFQFNIAGGDNSSNLPSNSSNLNRASDGVIMTSALL